MEGRVARGAGPFGNAFGVDVPRTVIAPRGRIPPYRVGVRSHSTRDSRASDSDVPCVQPAFCGLRRSGAEYTPPLTPAFQQAVRSRRHRHVDLRLSGIHIGSGKSEHHSLFEVAPEMASTREQLVRDAAARGKYAPLYRHLVSIPASPEWRVTFGEVESILGFRLPDSARLYRPWWSNQNKGAGHSHALSWHAAGWKTREVDLEEETLVFARVSSPVRKRSFDIDEFWPPVPGGSWPPGFIASREQLYDESGRLTGGPQSPEENDH